MPEFSEPQIRLGVFASLFLLLAVLEFFLPRRIPKPSKPQRWITNWVIVLIDSTLLRLLFVGAAVGAAGWAQQAGYGAFNRVEVPIWLSLPVSFVVLDFAVWFAHIASHRIPLLWRVHRMHHTDIDFDVSTAIRFHPIEIVLSMIWKMVIVVLIGAPPVAVLVFEVVLNGAAMFNHSNLKIPLALDRALRWIVVTPDMHRVHHSIENEETDSNFGFNLALWDRVFGTYIDQPRAGHLDMKIGLAECQNENPTRLWWTLKVPFLKLQ